MLAFGLTLASPAFADQGERGDGGDKRDHGQSAQRGDRGGGEDRDELFDFHGEDSGTCEGRQQFVRIEEKVCPPNPHRPVLIVKRTCCMNPAGKVHCRAFRQCPNHSPS
jgi:hypothetical protein